MLSKMLFTSSHVWDFPLSVTFCATNPPDRTRPFCRTLPDFYISRGTLFFSEHKMWYFKKDTQVLRVPQDRQFRRCVSSRLVSIYTASSFAKKKMSKICTKRPMSTASVQNCRIYVLCSGRGFLFFLSPRECGSSSLELHSRNLDDH